jgi:hypothetical protein
MEHDLLLRATLSQLLKPTHFLNVFLVVKNFFSITAEFSPLLVSTIFLEIDVLPSPKDFYFFDVVEHITHVDVEERLLGVSLTSFGFGLSYEPSFLVFALVLAQHFCPLVDDVFDTFDGFEIDSVLEVDETLLLVLVGLLDEVVDLADDHMLQLASLPGDLVPNPSLRQLQLVDHLARGQGFLDDFKVDLLREGGRHFIAASVFNFGSVNLAPLEVAPRLPHRTMRIVFQAFLAVDLHASFLVEQDDLSFSNLLDRELLIVLLDQLLPAYLHQMIEVLRKAVVRVEHLCTAELLNQKFVDFLNEIAIVELSQFFETGLLIEVFPLLTRNLVLELYQLIAENPSGDDSYLTVHEDVLDGRPKLAVTPAFLPVVLEAFEDALEVSEAMRLAGCARELLDLFEVPQLLEGSKRVVGWHFTVDCLHDVLVLERDVLPSEHSLEGNVHDQLVGLHQLGQVLPLEELALLVLLYHISFAPPNLQLEVVLGNISLVHHLRLERQAILITIVMSERVA